MGNTGKAAGTTRDSSGGKSMIEQPEKSRYATVAQDYRAQYSDPIAMRSGDEVAIGERDTEYAGWIWCTHADGRSGWVPESYLSLEGSVGRALRDYTARELSAAAGEVVELGEEYSGWVWAINARRESGWLPTDHLKVEPDPARTELCSSEDAG
jgi:hypothetical protein